jgi:hypothetical protein
MAAGDIKSVTPRADGWSVDVVIDSWGAKSLPCVYDFGLGANVNDPTAAKFILTVVSLGFDATGATTTHTRTIYGVGKDGNKAIRKPYPDQAVLDETVSGSDLVVRVGLSDPIYAKDKSGDGNSGTNAIFAIAAGWATNSGSTNQTSGTCTTNNSTLAYPKLLCKTAEWFGGRPVIAASSILFEVIPILDNWISNNRPYACVVANLTDGTHNLPETITNWGLSTAGVDATGASVVVASHTFSLSTMTQGTVCTISYTAYPWVGDSDSIVTSSLTLTASAARSVEFLNDKNGTFNSRIAFVDPASGSNSTGVTVAKVGGNLATAKASPYKTIWGARQGIRADNLTNYSRGDCDAGVIYLLAGEYYWTHDTYLGDSPYNGTMVPTTFAELLVVRDPDTSIDSVIIDENYAYSGTILCRHCRLKEVTLKYGVSLGGQIDADTIILDGCKINNAHADDSIANNYVAIAFLRCIFDPFARGPAVDGYGNNPVMFVRGCTGTIGAAVIDCLWTGNRITQDSSFTGYSPIRVKAGNTDALVYCNYWLNMSFYVGDDNATPKTCANLGIIQNLFESANAPGPIFQIFADGDTEHLTNSTIAYNTAVGRDNSDSPIGGRINEFYNDGALVTLTNVRESFCVGRQINRKGDVYSTNGTYVGNWPILNGCSVRGNVYGSAAGVWGLGDYGGLYSKYGTITFNFTNPLDRPNLGGNGDYTPTAGSDLLNRVPAAWAWMPYDLNGNRRATDGTGAAGAYAAATEAAPTVTGVTSSPNTGTAKIGDVISISVVFSVAVDVTGSPQILMANGGAGVQAPYYSGSTSTTLVFHYTVVAGDTSAGLQTASTSALTLNSGTIVSHSDGTTAAILILPAPANLGVAVDGIAPTVTINQASGQVDPTSTSPVNFTVVFSESVSDFATGDVSLTGTAGATTGTVTGSGTTYNVAVSGMTGSGTVIVSLAAGVAHDAAGNASAASTSTDHTVTYAPPVPDIPTNLTIAAGSGQIVLDCDVVSGATGYTWYRSMDSGSTYNILIDQDGTSYIDDLLTNGFHYYYKVLAYNDNGDSGLSVAVDAVPGTPPPLNAQINPNGSLNSNANIYTPGGPNGALDTLASDFTATLPTPIKTFPFAILCWAKLAYSNFLGGDASIVDVMCGLSNSGVAGVMPPATAVLVAVNQWRDRGEVWGYFYEGSTETEIHDSLIFGSWIPVMLVVTSATARRLYVGSNAPTIQTSGTSIPLSAGDSASWLDTVIVGPLLGKIARVAIVTVDPTPAQWTQWKTGLFTAAQVFPTGLVSSKPLTNNDTDEVSGNGTPSVRDSLAFTNDGPPGSVGAVNLLLMGVG